MRALLIGIALLLAMPATAKEFNKPVCGWWLPAPDKKPIFIGDCADLIGYSSSGIGAPLDITPAGNGGGGSKPGYGYGDSNHSHSGPPGQNK